MVSQLGVVNFAGCKIDTKLTYNYLRSLEGKILICVNFLRCNTYLEFMRNNKFATTIVFDRTLPFPSFFQSGEFVKQLTYCFHSLNEKFYWYTYG